MQARDSEIRFRFEIPLGRAAHLGRDALRRRSGGFMEPNARALIVDETRINMEVLLRHLQALGMGVASAADAKAAMGTLESTTFDVVFLTS